ncbi:peptidoglycan-associated lipoprotein Pal [Rhodovulum sp. DZ06]|uniref:peptidoglycan-associated lipoprotein Pal n=1 Tax=Rhodovulum sp. DZ06 TaxID=3425126 RepID=UPI003D33477E
MSSISLSRAALAALLALGLAACSNTTEEEAAALSNLGAGAGANGANAAAGALDPTSIEYFETEIGDRVLFATDSSSLSPEAQATLRAQAQWLMANPARSAIVEGHADERGTREYNLALGARRAAAARNFLVAEGVDPSRLRSVTFGKERPEALCSADACWSQNRRAVTVMAGPGPVS